MSRTRLAGIALPLLLAAALTGCTDAGGSTTSAPTTASPSALGGTSPTGSSPAAVEWPAELYEGDETTYADYARERHGSEGIVPSLGVIAGEAWGQGFAEITVVTREDYSYETQLICAPDTAVTLTDSHDMVLEAETCDSNISSLGDGSEITYRARTPDHAPVRLVVFETPVEQPPGD